MPERTCVCVICGKIFSITTPRPKKTCSSKCRSMLKQHNVERSDSYHIHQAIVRDLLDDMNYPSEMRISAFNDRVFADARSQQDSRDARYKKIVIGSIVATYGYEPPSRSSSYYRRVSVIAPHQDAFTGTTYTEPTLTEA